MDQADRWRRSLCFSSPLTPPSPSSSHWIIIPHPPRPLPLKIWHHTHATHTTETHLACQGLSVQSMHLSHWGRPHCYSWHGWVWMSAASVVHWFPIMIDWAKLAGRSIAGRVSKLQPMATTFAFFPCENCSVYRPLHETARQTFSILLCKPTACGQKWTGG